MARGEGLEPSKACSKGRCVYHSTTPDGIQSVAGQIWHCGVRCGVAPQIRNCNFCQTEYLAEARYLNRGQGKFCSLSCSSRHRQSLVEKPKPNSKCADCLVEFYRPPSKVRGGKSGLVFCSRKHKDLAMRIVGGITDLHPSHYGSVRSYRKIAGVNLGSQCARCGYNEYPEILEVNHIDCDRNNNSPQNLEILCPNCHSIYHFTTRTGKWSRRESNPH